MNETGSPVSTYAKKVIYREPFHSSVLSFGVQIPSNWDPDGGSGGQVVNEDNQAKINEPSHESIVKYKDKCVLGSKILEKRRRPNRSFGWNGCFFFQNVETKGRSLFSRLTAIKINHKSSQNRKIGTFSEPKINQKVKISWKGSSTKSFFRLELLLLFSKRWK